MPMIPAFCDDCGTPFPSGFFLENCRNVTLSGNRSGPCPNCGGMGSVIDGVFNVTHDAIEILSAPQWTFQRLSSLVSILSKAREEGASKEEIVDEIKKEAPELSSIVDAFPKTRMELYAFLLVLIAAATLLMNQCSSESETGRPQQQIQSPENVLNQAVENLLNRNG